MEYRDAEVEKDALERLGDADAMLLGQGDVPGLRGNMARPGRRVRRPDEQHPQVRLSSTLDKADWNNTVIVSGDVTAEVHHPAQAAKTASPWPCTAMACWRRHCWSTAWSTNSGSRSTRPRRPRPAHVAWRARKHRSSSSRPKFLGTGVVVLSYQPVRSCSCHPRRAAAAACRRTQTRRTRKPGQRTNDAEAGRAPGQGETGRTAVTAAQRYGARASVGGVVLVILDMLVVAIALTAIHRDLGSSWPAWNGRSTPIRSASPCC